MTDEHRYSFDDLHNRIWQITPAAWVIAKSRARELVFADLEDVQMAPDGEGAIVVVKFKTAHHGQVMVRGQVLANGDFALSEPEGMEIVGSIFDDQADERLAAVMERAAGPRQSHKD